MDLNLYNAMIEVFEETNMYCKTLLLDSHTKNSLITVITMEELYKYGILSISLLEEIDPDNKANSLLDCIAIISTENSPIFETNVLAKNVFRSIILISNTVTMSDIYISQLARIDVFSKISKFYEIPMCFQILSSNIAISNIDIGANLLFDFLAWMPTYQKLIRTIGISAINMSIVQSNTLPFIEVLSLKDDVSMMIAKNANSILTNQSINTDTKTTIVFVNRLADLHTPCLLPWNYESMIYEYLHPKANIVTINKICYVINERTDIVYKYLKGKEFGELCNLMKNLEINLPTNIKNYLSEQEYAKYILRHTAIFNYLLDYVTKKHNFLEIMYLTTMDAQKLINNSQSIDVLTKQRLRAIYLNEHNYLKKEKNYLNDISSTNKTAINSGLTSTNRISLSNKIIQSLKKNKEVYEIIQYNRNNNEKTFTKNNLIIYYIGGMHIMDYYSLLDQYKKLYMNIVIAGTTLLSSDIILKNEGFTIFEDC